MNCPTCNTPLPDAATWCWQCKERLADMYYSTTDVSPEARDRLEGGDAHEPVPADSPDVNRGGGTAETEQPLPRDQRRRVATSAVGHRSAGSPTLKDGR